MAIAGKLIGLSIDGAWTPCEIGCSLKFDNELLPASSESNGNWIHEIEGYKSWSMNVNGRVEVGAMASAFSTIVSKNMLPNQTYTLIWGSKDGAIALRGVARIRSIDSNAPSDTFTDYNIQFSGQGALTEVKWT